MRVKLKKLLYLALLTAISLVLFVVENQIPAPVPVPGVKLGLGNVIVVAVLFLYGPWEALAVLGAKILLSAILTGNLSALAYSAAGGLRVFIPGDLSGGRGVIIAFQILFGKDPGLRRKRRRINERSRRGRPRFRAFRRLVLLPAAGGSVRSLSSLRGTAGSKQQYEH